MSPDPCLDQPHTERFLRAVYLQIPGWLNIVSTTDWRGRCFPTDETGITAATRYATHLDCAHRPAGIYFRATTLRQVPVTGRGTTGNTLSVPMLWADVDYGTDGHSCPSLPPDAATAQQMIAAAGLPAPTLTVHSGGGLYPLWLLSERPLPQRAAALSEGVQRALAAAHERHEFTYGTGVGDLARVLRLPGSINRKTTQPRPCHVEVTTGAPVDPAAFPTHPPPQPTPPQRTDHTDPFPHATGRGPFDVLDHHAQWADIFTPAGWTYVKTEQTGAELWLRPGGATSDYSARCFAHNVVVHSETAGLPTGAGHRLTKARVFAHLWHQGNETAAARDLVAAARGHTCTAGAASLPQAVLAGIRDLAPTHAIPRHRDGADQAIAATTSELESWLATFTTRHQPSRLQRRLTWMRADSPTRLPHHARALVCESIAGHYPAADAVTAFAAAHRHHGHTDADMPYRLLSHVLGSVLAALQPALPSDDRC